MREYDVPYTTRVAIDCGVRVGAWFAVKNQPGGPCDGCVELRRLEGMTDKAEPRVLAFDIECTKAALKFPDAKTD